MWPAPHPTLRATLPRLRGARARAWHRVPSPRLRGEGGRRPDEGRSKDSPVADAAARHHIYIKVGSHDAEQTGPRPDHMVLIQRRQPPPRPMPRAADGVGREAVDLTSDQVPE